MINEHNCPRCNAPFLYFTQINTRVFYCGSDTQIPSMACRYASQLQERIKRLEECTQISWVIIANVDSGSWGEQRSDWREAAIRWRDEQFHPAFRLSEHQSKEAKL